MQLPLFGKQFGFHSVVASLAHPFKEPSAEIFCDQPCIRSIGEIIHFKGIFPHSLIVIKKHRE